jgi:hypothetical protein
MNTSQEEEAGAKMRSIHHPHHILEETRSISIVNYLWKNYIARD